MHDVAAAHVEVDAVEAGLLRPLGGVDVLLRDLLDLGDGERPDHVAVEVGQLGDVHRRGPDGRPVEGGRMVVEQRVLPGTVVLHLQERRAPVAVDHVDQDLDAGDVLVVVHAVAIVPAASLGEVHGRRLHRDDPTPPRAKAS